MQYTVEPSGEQIVFTVEDQAYHLALADIEGLLARLEGAAQQMRAVRDMRQAQAMQLAHAQWLAAWRTLVRNGLELQPPATAPAEAPTELYAMHNLVYHTAGFLRPAQLPVTLPAKFRAAPEMAAQISAAYASAQPVTAQGWLYARTHSATANSEPVMLVPAPGGEVLLFDADLWGWQARWASDAELLLGQYGSKRLPIVFWRLNGEPVAGLLGLKTTIDEIYPS